MDKPIEVTQVASYFAVITIVVFILGLDNIYIVYIMTVGQDVCHTLNIKINTNSLHS